MLWTGPTAEHPITHGHKRHRTLYSPWNTLLLSGGPAHLLLSLHQEGFSLGETSRDGGEQQEELEEEQQEELEGELHLQVGLKVQHWSL